MNPTESIETEVVEVGAIEAMTRGEYDVAIATARKWPRQPALVKSEMMTYATLDEESAAACFYSLPRGGKNICGPSVRLAEIAVTAFGNLRVACRVMQTVTQGDHPHVIVQATCMDMQKNVAVMIEKRRRIIGKKNAGGAISDDDINLAVNSCTAIAYRDCVFKIVPLSIVKPVYEQCRKVAVGDAKSLVDRRNRMVESFSKMGVSAERVLARLDKKKLEEITLDDIETLIGLHTTIREGEETIESIFPVLSTTNKTNAPAPTGAPTPTGTAKPATTAPAAPPTPAAATQTPESAKTTPAATQEAAASPVAQSGTTDVPAEPPQDEAKTAEQAPVEQKPAIASTGVPLDDCKAAMAAVGVTEGQVLRYLQGLKPPVARGSNTQISQLANSKLTTMIAKLQDPEIVKSIKDIEV